MAYTPYGPWTSGGAPGIDAPFLTALELYLAGVVSDSNITSNGAGILTMLGLVNNDAGVTITGTTNGSATLYQFLRGNVKAFYIMYNNYRNSTTTEQRITLPQAFTKYAHYFAPAGVPQGHIWNGGTQNTGHISTMVAFTASAPGPGNATSSLSAFNGYQIGDVSTPFDQIGLGVSLGANFTCGLFMIGI